MVRALDDNLIFKDINDYYRGVFSIYEFNNGKPVSIAIRWRDRIVEKKPHKDRIIKELSDEERSVINAVNSSDYEVLNKYMAKGGKLSTIYGMTYKSLAHSAVGRSTAKRFTSSSLLATCFG